MKRLKIYARCSAVFKSCVVSMITRVQVIYTQLRRRLLFPTKKRFWTKVVVIFILLYVLQNLFQLASELPISNMWSVESRSGLKADGSQFTLDGKPFTILSGAIHYFRVVPEYWEDRLRKLKAIGLNTVETYVPWNLHEPTPRNFYFDGNADIKKYIELAQKIGLYVIVRPGPYICAEWEFGGLPSWLLRDPEMEIRSFTSPYIRAVDDYFATLFPILVPLQYTKGGPIIAFQIENEYGNYGDNSHYMKILHDIFTLRGISELLFTSDGLNGARKALLPSVLTTVNFQSKPEWNLQGLHEIQPGRPLMVMEFWPGWFDHWGEQHKVMQTEKVVGIARSILKKGASINFYMFHGGTNFGFMNGANQDESGYLPTITSYDYDCPISETGDITPKYLKLHELLKKLQPDLYTHTIPEKLALPTEIKKSSYGAVTMTKYIDFEGIISLIGEVVNSEHVLAMEDLPINDDGGQSYGYILYRTTVSNSAESLEIKDLRDYGQVFVDGEIKGIIKWPEHNGNFNIGSSKKGSEARILDVFVENCGRVNYGMHIVDQKKGILGNVVVDKILHKNWQIVPFEFKTEFINKLLQSEKPWNEASSYTLLSQPALFMGTFTISEKPADTFLNMQGWHKGVVFVNSHNLGRYWKIGPQETLYVPAPWLKEGTNTVLVFDQHPQSSMRSAKFVNQHQLGPTVEHVPDP